MAVIWAREHWEGRDGSFENVINNTMTRTWKVKTSDKYDDQTVVVNHFASALGIVFLTPHPSNGFFTARKFDVKQESASPIAWRVNVVYSTEPLTEDEDEPENPLDRPVKVSWSSELAQEFTTKDKDGKPFINSAGDPFEPKERDDVRWIIKLTKNFDALPPWVANYVNKVNSSTLNVQGLSLAERTCKVQALDIGEIQVQNDIPYQEVSVELAYRPNTWDLDILDEGFNYIDGSTRKKAQVNGEDASEPILLDGDGGILSSPDADNAVFLTFKMYEEADLNDLPFA